MRTYRHSSICIDVSTYASTNLQNNLLTCQDFRKCNVLYLSWSSCNCSSPPYKWVSVKSTLINYFYILLIFCTNAKIKKCQASDFFYIFLDLFIFFQFSTIYLFLIHHYENVLSIIQLFLKSLLTYLFNCLLIYSSLN